jgi:GNAT superfamily N-acetyltransferase
VEHRSSGPEPDRAGDVAFRAARGDDLPAIVAMLADDPLGAGREDAGTPLDPRYVEAFAAIRADPNQLLVVAERGATVVGCLQITFIPGLSHLGMLRGQIESVRVSRVERGGGTGGRMIRFAIDACRDRGCGIVQLTTDKGRPDAHRFYAGLGFTASHEGMKLAL